MYSRKTIHRLLFYQPNPLRRNAGEEIRRTSDRLFKLIPWTTARSARGTHVDHMNATVPADTVVVCLQWQSPERKAEFWVHESHVEWCRFILRGWKKKGSTVDRPLEQLLEYVRQGRELPELERDQSVPDDQVVCIGKRIVEWEVEE